MNYELRPLGGGTTAGADYKQPSNGEPDRSRLLLEINNAVVSLLDLESLLKVIFDCVRQVFGQTAAATLSIYDAESDRLRVRLLHSPRPDTFHEGMPVELEGTPSGLAFTSRQTVLIHRLALEDFPAPLVERAYADGVRSGCSVPLVSRGRVVGALTVGASVEAAYSWEDAELLAQVGRQVATPVENALNYERATKEGARVRILLEVNNAIATNLRIRDLLRATSGSLRAYFRHDFAALSLYDEKTDSLHVHAFDRARPDTDIYEGEPVPVEGTLSGLAFATRRAVYRSPINAEETSAPMARRFFEQQGLQSFCCAPLVSRGRALGIIALGSRQADAMTAEDVELFERIAGQVAIGVENTLNFRRAERERERSRLLLEINNAVVSHLDLKELVKTVSASLRERLPHDAAGIALYEPEHNHLREYSNVSYGKLEVFRVGDRIPLEGTPAGEVFVTGRPMLIRRPNPAAYPADRYSQNPVEGSPKSACLAPLVAHGRKLGIAGVSSTEEERFTEADLELFTHIASQLALAVENALQYGEIEGLKNKLASEKLYLEEEIKTEYNFGEIVGRSDALKKVLRQVETVAPTDSCVLLCGETGTGKELIARAIHNLSARKQRTLVKLNCAAIPTGLLESELFGHERGAFTGAIAQRVGRFELAHEGTLLLDEVGEIPLELQPKLLRVLQEREFERLGSSKTIRTDVRLIAATNCDLPQMVAEKKFRGDLFYRLNVFPVTIPPLRERAGDIPLLAGYFTQKHSLRMNKRIESIAKETLDALCAYPWPGNVRELENFVERACILSDGPELRVPLAELRAPAGQAASPAPAASAPTRPLSLVEAERAHIEDVLRQTRGAVAGRGGAAEILGLPASTLRSRMKKLGLK